MNFTFLSLRGLCLTVLAATVITTDAPAGRTASVSPAANTSEARPFRLLTADPSVPIIAWDRQVMRDAALDHSPLAVKDFPVKPDKFVDLDIAPFEITSSKTRFVIGRKNGADTPFEFDTNSISLFRGSVKGHPGSHVFLAMGDRLATGTIEIPGEGKFLISSKDRDGKQLNPGQISVFQPSMSMSLPPGVPLCGLDYFNADHLGAPVVQQDANDQAATPKSSTSSAASTVLLKQLELAVDTDYEYFSLFGNILDATAYVYAAYGAVSDIYMRDLNLWVDVVFIRIWDDPNDLFNGPDPLAEFRPEWEANMGAVHRDAAQLFSGRRNYPFGGQAYLSALCSNFGYGVVGYIYGFFPDPAYPSPYSYDVGVTAHELGHNSGTGHTHDYGIDTCDNPNTTPQRGTIMSYCSQTWSGMNANEDLWFHTVTRGKIRDHVSVSACIVNDCNINGVEDPIDIAMSTSADTNFNGVPDECEDCNNNSILDPQDIAGSSLDLNANGIPDECEPDCNNNNVPDDRDILLGTSTDAYGNGIPDECEADCNMNGTSDYTEIQLDITLDKNRNSILDSCEDCNSNGTNDIDELDGAHFVWTASGNNAEPLREFHATVGVLTSTSSGSLVNQAQDLIIAPNGHILVTSASDDRVMEFDSDGSYLGDFVSAGSGGLDYPTGLIFSTSGSLLVSSQNTNSVLEYDGSSGAFIGAFVSAGSGGLTGPFGLTYDRNGVLFVTSSTNEVMKYNGTTGAFLGKFVSSGNNGTLNQPRGMTFKSDGNLLVASLGTDEVLEFEEGTGQPLGKWAQVGTATAITQDHPWDVRVGPNGHVYVSRTGAIASSSASDQGPPQSHLTDARMFEYNVANGWFRKTHIGGNDHGLFYATGFDFVNGDAIDCNFNQLQDSCDISHGTSLDTNTNGIPDECEVDCNANGTIDRRDIIPFGTSYDCNFNFIPDECDIASGFSQDCDNSGVPDECEDDCNGNGLGDACDVQSGFSQDCNNNAIPDECESTADCNNNGVADICDLFNGTATDCNDNDIPDTCDAAGGGLLVDVDFESGLPAGWTATGIFQVTGACAVTPTCDGSSTWAYAGSTATCTYDNDQVGELISPPIDLAPTSAVLDFCSMVNTEADFDFATVLVNGQTVFQESGTVGVWQQKSIDLSSFGGQTVTITFRFASDVFVTEFGWQVDNIRVTNGSEDCDSNGTPDECDLDCDGDGIPDGCDNPGDCVCIVANAPLAPSPNYPKNRYLTVEGNNPGQLTALRVTFVDLPSPYDGWNGTVMWVDAPEDVSELGGLTDATPPTFLSAGLSCSPSASSYQNWIAMGPVHIHHEGIVPLGQYEIQEIAMSCLTSEETNYSAGLSETCPKWGDTVGFFDSGTNSWSAPDGTVSIPSDIVAIIDKFQNRATAVTKSRVDIAPQVPDQTITVLDTTYAIDAFKGFGFPFVPGAPPCP